MRAGLHAEDTATVTVTLISEVSIAAAADYPAEGDDAVFRLTRAGSALAALTVPVTVEETGAMLGSPVPAGATFAAGAREAELRVPTAADAVSENDSRVTAQLASGSGWQLAPGAVSAALTVLDDDVAPVPVATAADVTDLVGGHDGGGVRAARDRRGVGGPVLEPDGACGAAGEVALVRPGRRASSSSASTRASTMRRR